MKSQQRKLISPESRCTYPGAIPSSSKEEEVMKRFYEQILKNFGHVRRQGS